MRAAARASSTRSTRLDADLICITGDIADSPQADYATLLPGARRAAGAPRRLRDSRQSRSLCRRRSGSSTSCGAGRRFGCCATTAVTIDVDGAACTSSGSTIAAATGRAACCPTRASPTLLAAAPGRRRCCCSPTARTSSPRPPRRASALTLSGHTHGGQLALPWFGGRRRNLAEFITAFDRGLYAARGRSPLRQLRARRDRPAHPAVHAARDQRLRVAAGLSRPAALSDAWAGSGAGRRAGRPRRAAERRRPTARRWRPARRARTGRGRWRAGRSVRPRRRGAR